MRRRWLATLAAVLAVALLSAAPVPAGPVPAGPVPIDPGPLPTQRVGLPPGMPPAARRAEPALPAPEAWPFGEAFPRTSGTGRLAGGALLWTDFLYDDNGAVSGPGIGESAGAWPFGTYRYPDENQAGNGADIFRAAIGATSRATWWRVDWNTLLDPAVPAAAFALDLDGSGGPAADWGGNVGVRSAGADHTLVLTAAGAYLDGRRVARTLVDTDTRSFIARVPRAALDPVGTSTVWLAAGLANGAGDAFGSLGPEHQHLPGLPNVFNLGFRDYTDEPADKNFWFEMTQATTLAAPGADVTRFSRRVAWDRLLGREVTPQRRVRGWSNRWYVSSIELGQGRVKPLGAMVDRAPNYLGRVQPYGVYVPTTATASDVLPLTWLLHSFTINHNQYSATMPTLLAQACEQRRSICATTLGRGPDGYYRNEAELDFWEVWRTLAHTYRLDADRTILAGYSMGGFGTFAYALDHPDLFAGMVILAAAAGEDIPRLENARTLPYYHAHGALDQLVPYADEAQPTIAELDRLGHRYVFDTYPTKDHIAWSLEDGMDLAGRWIAGADRVRRRNPGSITYRWHPADLHEGWGTGPTGTWWLRGLKARNPKAAEARARAISLARPERPVTPVRSEEPLIDPNGAPVVRRLLRWELGERPAARPRMTVALRNVGTARIRIPATGLLAFARSRIDVQTDGPTVLTLQGLPAGATVLVDGAPSGRTLALSKGTHRIAIGR